MIAASPLRYASVERCESALGPITASGHPFSRSRVVELDEAEQFPDEAFELAHVGQLARHYVPEELGGSLRSFDELRALLQAVSRRDLTVAIASAQTLLGATPIWIAGSTDQKALVASRVLGGATMALALTEEAHGADLLANEVATRELPSGEFELSGKKWLINNGARAELLTAFVRTGVAGNPRGFSLVLLDRRELCDAVSPIPKEPTHGIRGADISGFELRSCRVPESAIVGDKGAGLELTLKGLQVTRTLCPAFSLGACDAGLSATLSFARERKLYGQRALDIPHVKRCVAESFSELLVAECVAIACARMLHTHPELMCAYSAVAKIFVPNLVDASMKKLSTVLGARHYLRRHHEGGIFQKMMRDAAVVALFDGSTAVNLHALVLQLPRLLAAEPPRGGDDTNAALDWQRPLPRFDPARLELSCRRDDFILAGLPDAIARLRDLAAARQLDDDVARALLAACDVMRCALEELRGPSGNIGPRGKLAAIEAESFDHAERYVRLHAAASAIITWLLNRGLMNPFFSSGAWLAVGLTSILAPLAPPRAPAPRLIDDVLKATLLIDDVHAPFSLTSLQS